MVKRTLILLALLLCSSTFVGLAQDNLNGKLSISTQLFLKELKGEITLNESPETTPRLAPGRQGENLFIAQDNHRGRLIAAPDTIDGRAYISAFIRLDNNKDVRALERLGVEVQCKFDKGLVTANIPVDKLLDVAALDRVRRISVAQHMRTLTDKAREVTRANASWAQSFDALQFGVDKPYDGTGVLLAVVDNGIDFQHIAFKDKDGNSRIKRAYVYDGTNAKMYDSTTISQVTTDNDMQNHGTHTASIAGGSSVIIDGDEVTVTDDHAHATYGGLAPGTDLYLAGIKDMPETYIANAFQKICSYADSIGMPLVLSNSWGSYLGPHDGTGIFSDIINQYFGEGHPNHICIFASSNEGATGGFFVTGTASSSNPLGTVIKCAQATDTYYNYYQTIASAWAMRQADDAGLACNVLVIDKEGNVMQKIPVEPTIDGTKVELSDEYVFEGELYALKDYVNTQNKTQILLYGDNDGLKLKKSYYLAVQFYPKEGETSINVWSTAGNIYFSDFPACEGYSWTAGTDDMSICDEAAYENVISVGAYVSKNRLNDYNGKIHSSSQLSIIGDIAYFSGYATAEMSPTGQSYPWITAPGAMLVSAVNHYDTSGPYSYISGASDFYGMFRVNSNTTYPYGSMSGTSMAAPVVAGIVAQWLQASLEEGALHKNLTVNDVKNIMKETAIHDNFTDGASASRFGNGKIDAIAGLHYILGGVGMPAMKAEPSGLEFLGPVNWANVQTIAITGRNLTSDINVSISGSDAFTIDQTSFSPTDGSVDGLLTVTFKPTVESPQSATITITNEETEDAITIALSGATETTTPQVLWCEDNSTLYFLYSDIDYAAGSTYDGQTVTSRYFGIQDVCRKGKEWEMPEWAAVPEIQENCTRVVFDPDFAKVRPVSTYAWFSRFEKLTDIVGIENLNTSAVTVMNSMFLGCSSLSSISVEGFDVISVTNSSEMFAGCTSLETIYCDGIWAIPDMEDMFKDCPLLGTSADPDGRVFTSPEKECFAGSGTETDPYLITSTTDWNHFAAKVNAQKTYEGQYFLLANDLSFADYYSTDESNFTGAAVFPLSGNRDNNFMGYFDGGGHTISDVHYIQPYQHDFGLFGSVEEGAVKNLTLDNCKISGFYGVGGIVGMNGNGTIENCHLTASCEIFALQNGAYQVGGIVGTNMVLSTIRGCTVAAAIWMEEGEFTHAGGIAGYNGGTVEDCLVFSERFEGIDITNCGTIVGFASIGTTMKNCFYTCRTLDANFYGMKSALMVKIENSGAAYQIAFNEGVTSGNSVSMAYTTYENAPGVIRYDNDMLSYDGIFYLTEGTQVKLINEGAVTDGIPMGFAVTGSDGEDYSIRIHSDALSMPADDVTVSSRAIFGIDNGANGTAEHPYLITNCYELNVLSEMVNQGEKFSGRNFLLTNDLNFDLTEFTPIGGVISEMDTTQFCGTFDGNGKTIQNLKIGSESDTIYSGVFGVIGPQGIVKDLKLAQAEIIGSIAGGIAGACQEGTISGCQVDSSVIILPLNDDSNTRLGGIVGTNSNGTVIGCISSVQIGDSENTVEQGIMGGIAGTNSDNAVIRNCLANDLKFNGNTQYGAIVGANYGSVLHNNFYLNPILSEEKAPYIDYVGCGYDEISGVTNADVTDGNGAVKGIAHLTPPSFIGDEEASYALTGIKAFENGISFRDDQDQTCYLMSSLIIEDDANNTANINLNSGIANINVTLFGRTFFRDGYWSTICLPFQLEDDNEYDGINFPGTPLEGATVKMLQNASFDQTSGTLTFNFSEDLYAIEPGNPYFVKWETKGSPIANPEFKNVEIIGSEPNSTECDAANFVGLYDAKTFATPDRSVLILGAENSLYYPNPTDNPVIVGACYAYFELNNGLLARDPASGEEDEHTIKAIVFNFGDVVTGIREITTPSNLSNSWFTLDGIRLLDKPTNKGLYIHNGQKLLIK